MKVVLEREAALNMCQYEMHLNFRDIKIEKVFTSLN